MAVGIRLDGFMAAWLYLALTAWHGWCCFLRLPSSI